MGLSISAQTMSNTANGTFSGCSGTFVDNNGSVIDYDNNQSSTITFCPTNPGDLIKITFTSFNTEGGSGTCYDYLDVWYANSVGATGTQSDRFCGNIGAFSITSTSANGCISLQFISDGTVRRAGWTATISCITPCVTPIAGLVDSSTVNICSPNSTTPGVLSVPFNASNSSSNGQGTIAKYEWDWGDGTSNITTTPNTNHSFPAIQGIYIVKLKVRNSNLGLDPLGCLSTNPITRIVRVLPEPSYTGSTASPINVSCGSSTNLVANVTSQTITQATPTSVATTTVLPDGSGSSYISGIDYNGFFPSGATVSAGCYPTLTFNLEHSFAGDLSIDLISPTGQIVRVFNNGFTAGGSNLFGTCVDAADDLVPGCGATYTVVNTGGLVWPTSGAATGLITTTAACAGYTGPCQAGNYYPAGIYNSANSFAGFNGAALNGIWSIKLTDNLNLDDGTLFSWSLSFPPSCYGNLETITPAIASATWTNSGPGPVVPAQTTTSTVVTNPGPGICPSPGPCLGNKLANSVSVGPFPTAGAFVYNLTSIDQFGCQFVRPVTVNVTQFNVKVPGQPTIVVRGNKMDSKAKSAISKASRGDVVVISEIKASFVGIDQMAKKVSICTYEIQ